MSTAHHRFHTLDALRGVAAVAVMSFHWYFLLTRQLFPHGQLAVDFFFMLSGFVLSLAYQKRLDEGWSARSFMKARLIRFYPIYVLGLATGFLFAWKMHHSGDGTSALHLVIILLLGTLFLPSPGSIAPTSSFPFDLPTWSLFIELIANLFHALFLRRRSVWFLAAVSLVSACVLLGLSFKVGQVKMGGSDTRIYLGIPRVLFSYTIGMVLFRVWRLHRLNWTVPPWMLAVSLLALLAVPLEGGAGRAYEFSVILLAFPAIVFVGASSNPSARWVGMADLLGRISYPLYVLHIPLLPYFQAVWKRVFGHDLIHDTPWSGVIYILVVAGISALLDRFYDIPIREFLSRKFAGKRLRTA